MKQVYKCLFFAWYKTQGQHRTTNVWQCFISIHIRFFFVLARRWIVVLTVAIHAHQPVFFSHVLSLSLSQLLQQRHAFCQAFEMTWAWFEKWKHIRCSSERFPQAIFLQSIFHQCAGCRCQRSFWSGSFSPAAGTKWPMPPTKKAIFTTGFVKFHGSGG